MGRSEKMPVMSSQPVVAVVGPTAAGKTVLSLDLAEALGGEIVNTDSMQVYVGMDIGNGQMVHASTSGSPVKVAPVDYMPNYNSARRIVG